MKKTIYFFTVLALFLAGFYLLAAKFRAQRIGSIVIPTALGDEDEDDYEDDEEDDDDDRKENQSETEIAHVKLPDQIVKRLITTTIYDSDGDGVFDPDDSTPNINNAFIVEDKNFNGIADSYENK